MEDKQNQLIRINLSERDKIFVERKARESRMSLSCFCRNLVLKEIGGLKEE